MYVETVPCSRERESTVGEEHVTPRAIIGQRGSLPVTPLEYPIMILGDTTKVPLHDRINHFPNQITRINGFWSICHGF